MAGPFVRGASAPASLPTANTSLYWRSPTCGSPCPRPARRVRGVTLITSRTAVRCHVPVANGARMTVPSTTPSLETSYHGCASTEPRFAASDSCVAIWRSTFSNRAADALLIRWEWIKSLRWSSFCRTSRLARLQCRLFPRQCAWLTVDDLRQPAAARKAR